MTMLRLEARVRAMSDAELRLQLANAHRMTEDPAYRAMGTAYMAKATGNNTNLSARLARAHRAALDMLTAEAKRRGWQT